MQSLPLNQLVQSPAFTELNNQQQAAVRAAYQNGLSIQAGAKAGITRAELEAFLAKPAVLAFMQKLNAAPSGLQIASPVPRAKTSEPSRIEFAVWLNELKIQALQKGISQKTIDSAFAAIDRPNENVLKAQESQPEFRRTIGEYLERVVSPARVAAGKSMKEAHAELLTLLEAQTGVPGDVMIGIWGLESNFGKNKGDFLLVDALGTLAYAGRRPEYFRDELLMSLKILDKGEVSADDFKGSWAGAMGQPQFMPSSFYNYAVDQDGDGRRDIWNSEADVLGSMATYLQKAGKWKRDQPWGVEIKLPLGFKNWDAIEISPTNLKDERARSANDWAKLGIKTATGEPLKEGDLKGWLIFPAGQDGPAFLVYPNYKAILRYNKSASYALGVALVGQQAYAKEGTAAVIGRWPKDDTALTIAEAKEVQTLLAQAGCYSGLVDGNLLDGTRTAAAQWQRLNGLIPDGYPGRRLLLQLRDFSGPK